MFGKKKTIQTYDKEAEYPVIRASICNGEKVFGFKNRETGKFSERMVIRSERDLEAVCKEYGLTREEIRKEW